MRVSGIRSTALAITLVAALVWVPGAVGIPPPNDHFADATAITGLNGSVEGTTVEATHEVGEPLHAGEPGTGSVWYRWIAPGDGVARFDTCQGFGDTLLAVYTGPTVTSLTAVAANDDSCVTRSRVQLDTTAGTSYSIAVDGFEGPVTFQLQWSWQHHRPRNLSPPTISGAAVENGTLVGFVGQWQYADSTRYFWESCVPGTLSCEQVPTGPRLTLGIPTALFGKQIRLQVTAIGPGGFTTASSAFTAPVGYGLPINTLAPSIAGFVQVGQTLTAEEGQWDLGHATRLNATYRWQRCNQIGEACSDIGASGTGRTYKLTAADRSRTIRLIVTMISAGGATSEASFPTDPVLPAPRCRVPRLVGKTLKTARRSLARAKCRVGVVRRAWSVRRRGVIVAQRPKAGTRLRVGGRVNVVLSKGRRR